MKECRKCGWTRSISEFYKDSSSKDGLFAWCKSCWKSRARKRNTIDSIKKLLQIRWEGIRYRTRSHPKYIGIERRITKEEFETFSENDPNLERLFNEWIASGKSQRIAPSIDRIDPKGHYELGNLRWIPFTDNASRSCKGLPQTQEHRDKRSESMKRFYKSKK